jgi:K+/H+ antiporter YhaU regulatory subunit KhtT
MGSGMDEEIANRIIDLQAEITALRGAVRMLLHNTYNANDSALAVLREKALQVGRIEEDDDGPIGRSTRYRARVREAVASLLDPFQPDDDEASRLANPAPAPTRSSD